MEKEGRKMVERRAQVWNAGPSESLMTIIMRD